jgi:transketolase
MNRLGQRGETELGWDAGAYARRVEAFGAHAVEIDGHDLDAIEAAYQAAATEVRDRPTVIIAKTIKGRGFSEIEDKDGWHGVPLPEDMAERAIAELGGVRELVVRGPRPDDLPELNGAGPSASAEVSWPQYPVGEEVSTRKAYGQALAALGATDDRVVALDAEVSNSTHASEFHEAHPERYFEMFIAEQQMIGAATGLAVRGYKPFASTFAAFLTRAHDFVRMGAISGVDLRLAGSHAGVEIGADGPSQMGLEDLAMMRAVHGSTVLHPSDATSAVALVAAMASNGGISYIRTNRGGRPVLYENGESFAIGGSKVLRSSEHDDVTLVGVGVTVHSCLAAAEMLERDGIHARVLDCYSVKPIDIGTVRAAVDATGGRIVVAEDHHPEGGLASAVTEALLAAGPVTLHLEHLAVREMPGSGSGDELLAWAGLDGEHVADAARRLVKPE